MPISSEKKPNSQFKGLNANYISSVSAKFEKDVDKYLFADNGVDPLPSKHRRDNSIEPLLLTLSILRAIIGEIILLNRKVFIYRMVKSRVS